MRRVRRADGEASAVIVERDRHEQGRRQFGLPFGEVRYRTLADHEPFAGKNPVISAAFEPVAHPDQYRRADRSRGACSAELEIAVDPPEAVKQIPWNSGASRRLGC